MKSYTVTVMTGTRGSRTIRYQTAGSLKEAQEVRDRILKGSGQASVSIFEEDRQDGGYTSTTYGPRRNY